MSAEGEEVITGLGELQARVGNLESRFDAMESKLDENTDATKAIASDTADLVAFTKTVAWLAKIARPLGYITTAAAGVAGFWAAMKTGIGPK